MKLKGSFFVIIMLLAVVANAQVPRVISYQGVLTASPGGSPVNGMRNLGFALYESEDDFATPIWTETHLGVHVQHGVFAVYLGSATPFPSSVDFSKQYWLGISIDGGAELTPRFLLTASPYAMNIPSMGAEDGQVLKWNATDEKWEPADDDFGCFELSSDSTERDQGCVPWYLENNVIYTATGDPKECKPQVLGISKGAVNSLQGSDSLETHVNLGVNCTTGTSRTYIVYPTISGGKGNTANSNFSTIAGGKSNIVSGDSSVVSGGANNTVSGVNSAVPGGSGNTVSGNYSLAFGKDVEVDGNYQVAFFSDSIPGKLGVNSDSLIATLDIRGDAVFNANQDDHDFRIAGDSVENLFFVDASTNRIGIGTNTPGAEEHVSIFKGNIAVDNGINGLHTSLLASASDTFAAMVFRKNGTRHAGMRWDGSKLEIINASHSHYDPDLWRYGGPPLATFNIQQGKVGILTDSPAYELDVNGDVGISGNLDLSAGTIILDSDGDPPPGAGYVLRSTDGGIGWTPIQGEYCTPWVIDDLVTPKILFTGHNDPEAINEDCIEEFFAVARGGLEPILDRHNSLFGNQRETHINLGGASQTGKSGENQLYCTVSGGLRNYALKSFSTVAGGDSNVVNGDGGFIGGGLENHIEGNGVWGLYCVIAGGTQNSSAGNWTTIGGGFNNTIEGEYGTIGGGQSNTVTGDYSVIPGGIDNSVSGDYSFAFGNDVDVSSDYRAVFFSQSNTGRVGVNNETPAHALDVDGTGQFTGELTVGAYTLPNTDGTSDYVLKTDGSGNLSWVEDEEGTDNQTLQEVYNEDGNDVEMTALTGGDIRFYNDASDEILFLKESNGYVGIGTTSPGKKLDVRGGVVINEDAGNHDFRVEGISDPNLLFADANTDKVGIGTNSPGEKLEIRGKVTIGDRSAGTEYTLPGVDGDPDYILITDGAGNVDWGPQTHDDDWSRSLGSGPSGEDQMYPSNIGDFVGIGLVTPKNPLHVQGSVDEPDWYDLDDTEKGVGYFRNINTEEKATAVYGLTYDEGNDYHGYGGTFFGGKVGVFGEALLCVDIPTVSQYGLYGRVGPTLCTCEDDGGDKYGLYAEAYNGDNNYGAYGLANGGNGSYNYGLYGKGLGDGFTDISTNYGLKSEAEGNDAENYGAKVSATGEYSSYFSTTNYGVDATASGDNATNYGVRSNANGENSNYGVYSTASGLAATNYAVYSNATGSSATNYGIYATASGGTTNWAGYFDGKTKVAGSLTLPITEKSSIYTVTDDDYTIVATDDDADITLLHPSGLEGRVYIIKNKEGSGGLINVFSPMTPSDSYIDDQDGDDGWPVSEGGCIMIQSNGTDTWYVLPVK